MLLQRRRGARLWQVVLVAACVAALSACGTTEAPERSTTGNGEPITVVDGRGNEVTLEHGPAQRVVALEWAQTEMVVSLGVDPVGVADMEGYQSWVGESAPLPGDTTDVGLRQEPSTETIVDLEPDLIVGIIGSIPESELEHLERVAPVALFTGADAEDPLGRMREDFQVISELVGAEAQAEEVLADFDQGLSDNASTLEEAGLAGKPVVIAYPLVDGSNLSIRMHGPGAAPQQVAEQMGLTSAWEDPGDDEYGLSNTDIEGLTNLPDDTALFWWGNEDEDDGSVAEVLEGNAVWQNLPFVENDGVHVGAVGIWIYGGPVSLGDWSDDLVAQLTQ